MLLLACSIRFKLKSKTAPTLIVNSTLNLRYLKLKSLNNKPQHTNQVIIRWILLPPLDLYMYRYLLLMVIQLTLKLPLHHLQIFLPLSRYHLIKSLFTDCPLQRLGQHLVLPREAVARLKLDIIVELKSFSRKPFATISIPQKIIHRQLRKTRCWLALSKEKLKLWPNFRIQMLFD